MPAADSILGRLVRALAAEPPEPAVPRMPTAGEQSFTQRLITALAARPLSSRTVESRPPTSTQPE
ncbi:hypothetical protein [Streptomyces sp. NPDC001975]